MPPSFTSQDLSASSTSSHICQRYRWLAFSFFQRTNRVLTHTHTHLYTSKERCGRRVSHEVLSRLLQSAAEIPAQRETFGRLNKRYCWHGWRVLGLIYSALNPGIIPVALAKPVRKRPRQKTHLSAVIKGATAPIWL